jgi:hypothetical protein
VSGASQRRSHRPSADRSDTRGPCSFEACPALWPGIAAGERRLPAASSNNSEDIAPSLREQTVDQPALPVRSRASHCSYPARARRCGAAAPPESGSYALAAGVAGAAHEHQGGSGRRTVLQCLAIQQSSVGRLATVPIRPRESGCGARADECLFSDAVLSDRCRHCRCSARRANDSAELRWSGTWLSDRRYACSS